jgi:succinate-semialdehyde dehydrogenase/glutarate-semialdehyde dehydrogenase
MSDLHFAPESQVRGRVYMGGAWYEKDEQLISLNPATGDPIGSVPLCNRQDVAAAVNAARDAQPGWAERSLHQRFDCLDMLRSLLIQEGDALASLITQESGKPLAEAHFVDVGGALDFLKGLLSGGPNFLKDRRVRATNPLLWRKRLTVRRVPLGVVGVISPWNLPLAIPLGQVATALAAGNTVVLKPSEFAPLVGAKIATLFHRAGFPPGVFNLVTGDKKTGAFLVESPIDGLLFTGSTGVGQRIQAQLGPRFVHTQMEMGGKDAFLVLPDADFERTVNGALWGGLFGAGQACSSAERFFVPRSWMPRFAEAVAERARALKVGNGMDESVQVGPLICEVQRAKVEHQVADAVAKGARLLCGGRRPDRRGYFYEPTVLADVPLDCALMCEETFGPVIPVVAYDELDEAIAWCNDTPFGLSASVWTSVPEKGEAVARRLQVGSVWVNDTSFTQGQAQCPWGGVKASGRGRTHWLGSLHELTVPQLIGVERKGPQSEIWWYPYGGESVELYARYRRFSGEGLGGMLLHALPLMRAYFRARGSR